MTTTQEKALEHGGYQGNRCGLGRTRNNHTTTPLTTAKQRLVIINYLVAGNRLTTLHARDELGIMHSVAEYILMNG